MAAKQSKLQALHEMFAEVLLDDLRQSKEEGIPLPAANLGVIRQFLKDNDISADIDAEDMEALRTEFEDELAAKRQARREQARQAVDNDEDGLTAILT